MTTYEEQRDQAHDSTQREVTAMTDEECAARLRAITVERTSSPVEPIQTDGWYENQDGTRTHWHSAASVNGPREGSTLRSDASRELYDALCLRLG